MVQLLMLVSMSRRSGFWLSLKAERRRLFLGSSPCYDREQVTSRERINLFAYNIHTYMHMCIYIYIISIYIYMN